MNSRLPRAWPPLAAGLLVAAGVLAAWSYIVQHRRGDLAELFEASSYAARAHIAQQLQIRSAALHELADFWAMYGRLPQDQWTSDTHIELSHFRGIEAIAWVDPDEGIRYYTTPKDFSPGNLPTPDQWQNIEPGLDEALATRDARLSAPLAGDDGHVRYRVYIPVSWDGARRGVLIALVDGTATLASLLENQSPDYAIRVSWDGTLLFSRGEAVAEPAEDWVREGLIRVPDGPLWKVTHMPTPALMKQHDSPAPPLFLLGGLAIATLVTLLLRLKQRAESHARSAEATKRELDAINRNLESLVEQRTNELSEALTDLETVSASVAHDLRSPLQAIELQSELLRERLTDRMDEWEVGTLRRVEAAVHHSHLIADRLAAFARRDWRLQREAVDIAGIAREVFEDLNGAEDPPGAELEVEDGLPRAYADPLKVRILLTNLIENALKFTRGQAHRRIRVGSVRRDGRQVLYVADNGAGFTPDTLPHLDGRSAGMPRLSDDGGYGMGLIIVARIMARHGGRVWAESGQGNGTTVYFWFAQTAPDQDNQPQENGDGA